MNNLDLIQKYFRGEASQQEKDLIAKWICSSEENYRAFQRIKNVWEVEHPVFSETEVEAMMKAEKKRLLEGRGSLSRTFFRLWSTTAAILVIPLAVGVVMLLGKKTEEGPNVNQTVSCAFGAVSNFMLPDGSEVYLNSGSTISFPAKFDDTARIVNLRGEGYFEVLSDKDHPFTVRTDGMDITATGTKFNVEAYPGFASRVTLVSGVLNIEKGVSRYSLPQGHQLQCTADGVVSSFRTDTYKWTSWKDGIIAFRGDELSYVFERLVLIYNAKIIVEDAELNRYQIRATFTDERLDEIMALLEKCAPIRCERQNSQFKGEKEIEYHLFLDK